jgi:hypothetical protein
VELLEVAEVAEVPKEAAIAMKLLAEAEEVEVVNLIAKEDVQDSGLMSSNKTKRAAKTNKMFSRPREPAIWSQNKMIDPDSKTGESNPREWKAKDA